MPLHLVKLCVGVSEVSHLRRWVRDARKGLDSLDHTTRMFPTRGAEILDGGSLYWVIKGVVQARQKQEQALAIRIQVAESDLQSDPLLAGARISVSIGVAQYRGDRKQFFAAADRALYSAKAQGKNCVVSDAEL